MEKRSPLNIGRSRERNTRKQARHTENVAYRASLHREKDSADFVKKDLVQRNIDAISKRG